MRTLFEFLSPPLRCVHSFISLVLSEAFICLNLSGTNLIRLHVRIILIRSLWFQVVRHLVMAGIPSYKFRFY